MRILQAYFLSKVRLKACKFPEPIPPRDFGLHILQLIQAIFSSCRLSPPKVSHHSFKLFTKALWKLEAAHWVGGDGLDHCLDENFPIKSSLPFQPASF